MILGRLCLKSEFCVAGVDVEHLTLLHPSLSPQGRESMSPIVLSGKGVIKTSSNLLVAAKSLAVNPNDAATWQLLASHSKSVGEAVRALLSSLK